MNRTVLADSPATTEAIAHELVSGLAPGTVIALHGDLGAGKTCFVRGLARGLGLDPAQVVSPTFVIEHRYGEAPVKLVHIDAYRLHGPADLEAIGWDELLREGSAIVAVEWASRVAEALPEKHLHVTLEHAGPETRRILIRRH